MAKVKFFETVHSPSPSPPHTYSEISDGYNCNKLKNMCSKEIGCKKNLMERHCPRTLARNWSLSKLIGLVLYISDDGISRVVTFA